MSSIATTTGDSGQTGLVGGLRVSKADLRVESYGTVDELNTFLGFARAICTHAEVKAWTETIQRTLFRVGAALSTPLESRKAPSNVTAEDVAWLTAIVHQIESTPGILADWSLPGAHTESAAYEMARTVCRRAERIAIRFRESGAEVPAEVIAYLNRLSDAIWLFGRLIEVQAGVDATLRQDDKAGPKFSRAW
jgi:cob(I)alamin adenosyltransferase